MNTTTTTIRDLEETSTEPMTVKHWFLASRLRRHVWRYFPCIEWNEL